METCVASYTPPHQPSNEVPPSPTNSTSSNLDNDTMLTSSLTTPIPTPLTSPTTPTPTPATAITKKIINNQANNTAAATENEEKNEIIQMDTPPATPTSPRRINQLHRRLSRYPSTTLSDLIPAATAVLKASQQLKKETERPITEEGQEQYQQQRQHDGTGEQVLGSTFARALAKVRVQVQTKRLKEKYLTLEWVRLALALPVDESIINNSKHPLPPMKKKYVDPEQLLQEQQQRTRITREERDDDGNITRMIALKSLKGRTGEIATWYEWKFDKSKLTIEQVESKVDRLRTRIQEKKQTISTFIT